MFARTWPWVSWLSARRSSQRESLRSTAPMAASPRSGHGMPAAAWESIRLGRRLPIRRELSVEAQEAKHEADSEAAIQEDSQVFPWRHRTSYRSQLITSRAAPYPPNSSVE